MKQQELFPKQPRERKLTVNGAKYEAENLAIARLAIQDPDRFGHLQAWAICVLRNRGLLIESEAA